MNLVINAKFTKGFEVKTSRIDKIIVPILKLIAFCAAIIAVFYGVCLGTGFIISQSFTPYEFTLPTDTATITNINVKDDSIQISGEFYYAGHVIKRVEFKPRGNKLYFHIITTYDVSDDRRIFDEKVEMDTSKINEIYLVGSNGNKLVWSRD